MTKVLKALVAIVSFAVASCNNGEQSSGQPETDKQDSLAKENTIVPADTSLPGCYSWIANRDTASLQLETKGPIVRGSLTYNLYEKDRNDGTFEGEVQNDILTGWYLFRSEGIMSVRQVVWKIRPGYLWPATGNVISRNDSVFFSSPDKLSFDSTRAFVKVKCTI